MKWIAVILVLTNVGAYLWIARLGPVDIDIETKNFESINLAQMSLKDSEFNQVDAQKVDEESITRIDLTQETPKELTFVVEEPKQADVAVLEPKREPIPEVVINSDSLEVKEATETSQVVARLCYRIGPYLSNGALENALSVMDANAVSYLVPKVSSKNKIKAVRVYLGPYDKQEEVTTMRAKLKEQRVDHYLLDKEGKSILQLGYFSGMKRGESYQNSLLKAGFDAKLEKIVEEKAADAWIHFELYYEAKLKELEELKLYRAASIEKRNCA